MLVKLYSLLMMKRILHIFRLHTLSKPKQLNISVWCAFLNNPPSGRRRRLSNSHIPVDIAETGSMYGIVPVPVRNMSSACHSPTEKLR